VLTATQEAKYTIPRISSFSREAKKCVILFETSKLLNIDD
jgi:hypothetical protein